MSRRDHIVRAMILLPILLVAPLVDYFETARAWIIMRP